MAKGQLANPRVSSCIACLRPYIQRHQHTKYCCKDCQKMHTGASCLVTFSACGYCGEMFSARISVAKYCRSCSAPKGGLRADLAYSLGHRAKVDRHEKVCGHCKQRFRTSYMEQMFCSKRCSALAKALPRKRMAAERRVYRRWAGLARKRRTARAKRARLLAGKRRSNIITQQRCDQCHGEFDRRGTQFNRVWCSVDCRNRAQKRRTKAKRRAVRSGSSAENVNPFRVFTAYRWRCAYCGQRTPRSKRGTYDANAPELDHTIPLSKGGSHSYANTQLLCRQCNGDKGDLIVQRLVIMPASELRNRRSGKGVGGGNRK